MPIINPECRCRWCGAPCASTQDYDTLRCRDAAKLARRRKRERKAKDPKVESFEAVSYYPDSDPETLALFAEQYLLGSLSEPTYFAAPAGEFSPPPGISYIIDPVLRTSRMAKL